MLKPNASIGSCHVFKCADEREVASAFEVITKEPDDEGFHYDTVPAEEYLDGDEYFINLLHDGSGESRIVSMARYEKIQRDILDQYLSVCAAVNVGAAHRDA